ncbi:MAG TPA: nicotinate-nucleotide adenylyltransferase [Burkholderiales bacterium]|nr:nicotinate-nucleotide adenylyltransferase [Burkholderiales bacterium]
MATASTAIGILGGRFDPIHYGHLRLAQEAGEALRLATVRLIPTGTPPHRGAPEASAEHRLAMVKLAIAGNPLLAVDECEMRRAGPAYTVDTLTAIRDDIGNARPLALLLGADAFLDLASWSRWQRLFELAHIVVAHRPGYPVESWQKRMASALAREYTARCVENPLAIHECRAGGIVVLPIAELDIAASRLRLTLRSGRSPRYLLPDSVLDYIRAHHLYA